MIPEVARDKRADSSTYFKSVRYFAATGSAILSALYSLALSLLKNVIVKQWVYVIMQI